MATTDSGLQPSRKLARADRTTPTPQMQEIGIAGTRISFSGYISEEDNPDLQGLSGLRKYKQMSYDPTVASVIKAVELPIRATQHYLEPSSDDPDDVFMADFVHHCIWDFGQQSFDEIVRMAIGEPLTYGFQPMEICWDRIMQGQFAGLVGWSKLAYRAPTSRLRWNIEEMQTSGGGRLRQLVSMTQQAAPDYTTVDIEREKLLLFVNEQLGENFDGVPFIRYAYAPWFYKTNLCRIEAVGLERAYMGIPDAELPEDYTAEEFAAAQTIVQNMRTHENTGAVHSAAIKLNMLHGHLEGATMRQTIDFHDTQITMAMLAQFLKLGHNGAGGAYALSEDQSDLFLMCISALANQFAQVINLWPGIPQLIGYNFPDVDPARLPRLVRGQVGQRDLDMMGRVFNALGQWGFLTPDDPTEDRLREMLELPERDNTVTPEALHSLTEGINRVQPNVAAKHGTARPGPVEQTKVVPGQQEAAQMSEMQARMAWRRPDLRNQADRLKIKATEQAMEFMESSLKSVAGRPELPSHRIARLAKPYVIRDMAEPIPLPVRPVADEHDHGPATGGSKIIPRHASIARKHEKAIREAMLEIKNAR